MGTNIFAGVAQEVATWPTAVSPRTAFTRVFQETQADHEKPLTPVTFMNQRVSSQIFAGVERGMINPLTIPLVYDGNELLLLHMLGQVVDGEIATPFTHTYSIADDPYKRVISSSVAFFGVGLDDMTTAGTLTDTVHAKYTIEIDLAAGTDTFTWNKDGGAETAGVSITGAAQTLSDGVTVTFAATTGHTLGEGWVVNVQPPLLGLSMELHAGLTGNVGSESWLLNGGRCRGFSGSIKVGEEIKLVSDWIGQKVISGAKTASPTFPAYDSDLVLATSCAILIDGGSANVYGIDFAVNHNLQDDKAFVGSQYIAAPYPRGKSEFSGTISKEWDDKTLYDKFIAGSTATLLITATSSALITTIRMNNIVFNGKTPALVEGDGTDQELPFIGLDDSTYTAFEIVQTNTTVPTV